MRLSVLMKVDLPQPEGPMIEVTFVFLDVQADIDQGLLISIP